MSPIRIESLLLIQASFLYLRIIHFWNKHYIRLKKTRKDNGIKNFEKVGCYLFNLINNEYAKKIIVMLPNQNHPSHHHKVKNETFHILSGNLILVLDGKKKILKAGDIIDIKKNSNHKFKAGSKGCIFDEISTTSIKSDSFYKNSKIKKMKRFERKTTRF